MAIKKGIEVGDTLWVNKEVRTTRQSHIYYREVTNGTYDEYNQFYLFSRRARSNGAYISEEQLPFFRQLGIKVVTRNQYGRTLHLAIGVDTRRHANPDPRDIPVISPHVQAHYNRTRNKTFSVLLENLTTPVDIIAELRSKKMEPLEVEAVVLPPEQDMTRDDRYILYSYPHVY